MATVLELVKSACYQQKIPAPSTLFGNTNASALKLLHTLYSVCRELRASRAFPQQKKSHSITFTAARDAYPLPEDFYSGLLGTQMNRSQHWELVGPVSDDIWNYWLYGPGYGSSRTAYRVFGPDSNQSTAGGQLKIHPTPSASDVISFDYISKNLFMPPNWTAGETVTINHYRNANGKIYKYTTGGVVSSTPPSHTSGSASDGAGTALLITAPYETILNDSDLCLFDDDVVINGLLAKFLGASGIENSEPARQFQRAIDNSKNRWVGSYKGNFSRRAQTGRRYGLSDGPGGWPIT